MPDQPLDILTDDQLRALAATAPDTPGLATEMQRRGGSGIGAPLDPTRW